MKELAEDLQPPRDGPTSGQQEVAAHDERGDAGDEIERLISLSEVRLGRFLAQMVGNHSLAEDLLQDTYCDAFRLRGQLGEVENPEAWLFGIARNRALAALRRRRRLESALKRLLPRPDPSERDDLELLALRDLLQRHLEPDDRALLILRYLHGFGATELASMTGRTPEAVRQRLARAKSRLIRAANRESDPSNEE